MGLAAPPLSPALAVSVVLHVGVLALALAVGVHRVPAAAPPVHDEGSASWLGETFDVDEVLASRAAAAAAAAEEKTEPAPDPAPNADAVPVPVPKPPPRAKPEPKKPKNEPKRKPKSEPKPSARQEPLQPKLEPRLVPIPPGAAQAMAANANATATANPSAQPSQGELAGGTQGQAPALANLVKAFTKAVTAATERDPYWDGLPLGDVGSAKVMIQVDADGRITSTTLGDEKHVPDALKRLVSRTLVLLRAGRFALSQGGAGSETLAISVHLTMTTPDPDDDDPRHTVSLGFDAPTSAHPGVAYFVHASGRRFDAKISLSTDP